MFPTSFPHFRQHDRTDCGPTCLRIIGKYYAKDLTVQESTDIASVTRSGTSLLNLSIAAERIGLKSTSLRCTFKVLQDKSELPCIVLWNNNHYIVVYKIEKSTVYLSDPASPGLTKVSTKEFCKGWQGKYSRTPEANGIVLLLKKTKEFKTDNGNRPPNSLQKAIEFIGPYVDRYKAYAIKLLLVLLFQSLLAFAFPFLTQSIVDVGIQAKDIDFVYLILACQFMIGIGQIAIEVIRGRILLRLGASINLSLASDFLVKLMKLPISFFDIKLTGDIIQRINDNSRIESFLTSSVLGTIFSLFNAIVFSILLIIYSLKIFLFFVFGTIMAFLWIRLFMPQRAKIDSKKFELMGKEKSKVIELIYGMQDIKMHNAEEKMRWNWKCIQSALYRMRIKSLRLEQKQQAGAKLINTSKDVMITLLSATSVMQGEMTLGMMLSVAYMVSQINAPIENLVAFIFAAQNAKLSLERLTEIHNKGEEPNIGSYKVQTIRRCSDIDVKNVYFRFPGQDQFLLEDINLTIPMGKTTAIVGPSGGGKTTLMKLIMKSYTPTRGEILFDNNLLNDVPHPIWRANIGTVTQDAYIFNESIAKNIAMTEIDKGLLINVAKIANIEEFVLKLPNQYETIIGSEGEGLSSGQRQRILLARALYKDPDILLLDEPTSDLDARNEKLIMANLNSFAKDKTVVLVAHRLNTIKNADQIVVIDKGRIVEIGNHEGLIQKRGMYCDLIRDQLYN